MYTFFLRTENINHGVEREKKITIIIPHQIYYDFHVNMNISFFLP